MKIQQKNHIIYVKIISKELKNKINKKSKAIVIKMSRFLKI